MKMIFFKKMSVLIVVMTMVSPAVASTFRQDLGYYRSSQIWVGSELMDFADLDGTSTEGSVSTMYAGSTFTFDVDDVSELAFHFRIAESTMNNFSAGGAVAGESQFGLADIGFAYSRVIKQWDNQTVGFNASFSTPGDPNQSPYKFNAITDGQTKLKIGADYSLSFGLGSVAVGLSYTMRPGRINMINVNDAGEKSEISFDVPDMIGLDVSLPFYFGTRYAGLLLNHEQALSGVDIMTPAFGAGGSIGRPPFPATREIRTFVGAIFGMVLGDGSSLDVTVNSQVNGRNTDKGLGINLGYSLTF